MRRVITILVLILAAVCASAVEFNVDISPEQQKILLNETAEFNVSITHNSPTEQVFEVYSPDIIWEISTDVPLAVKPYKKFEAKVLLRPLNVNPGFFGVPLNFRLVGTNDVVKKNLVLETLSPFPPDMTYLPAIRGLADVSSAIDPREDVTIGVRLENQNKRNLSKVDIKIRSKIVNKDYTTTLGPMEKKALTFTADLDPKTPPQIDILRVTVIVPEEDKAYQFDLLPVEYKVLEYGGVNITQQLEKQFLKRTKTIKFFNDANKQVQYEFKLPTSFIIKPFVSAEPEAKSVSGALAWSLPLNPGEEKIIVVKYNYFPIFWVILAIIVLIIAYYVFRSPVVVHKTARVISTRGGGISELKVVIEVVNRGMKPVRHVKVMDLVPQIADVINEFEAGTLVPTKLIPHERRGTLVKWEVGEVESKEHRIITYKVRSKLSILGGLTLPVAVARFASETGKEYDVTSNQPRISFTSE